MARTVSRGKDKNIKDSELYVHGPSAIPYIFKFFVGPNFSLKINYP